MTDRTAGLLNVLIMSSSLSHNANSPTRLMQGAVPSAAGHLLAAPWALGRGSNLHAGLPYEPASACAGSPQPSRGRAAPRVFRRSACASSHGRRLRAAACVSAPSALDRRCYPEPEPAPALRTALRPIKKGQVGPDPPRLQSNAPSEPLAPLHPWSGEAPKGIRKGPGRKRAATR